MRPSLMTLISAVVALLAGAAACASAHPGSGRVVNKKGAGSFASSTGGDEREVAGVKLC
jgi:hypothetical protein